MEPIAVLRVLVAIDGITETNKAIQGMGAKMQDAAKDAEKATGKIAGAFDDMKGKVKVAAAAAGAAGGAALIGGVMQALDVEAANDKLAAQLGATGKDAKKLGKVAGDLYSNAYGDSLGDVNTALKGVIQQGLVMQNASQGQLKSVTASVLDLATAFDQDLGETTRAVGQMMKTGLAKNAKEAMDVITVGFQRGADKGGDLLDTMNEYGTQFRKVGLDGKTAMGLISQGLKGGARDADIVADAIKEFSIRAVDGSDTTKKGFDAIGVSAKGMAAQIAKGGPAAKEGLDTVLDKLRAIKDPAERSQAAVALFGTQAEDLGDALFKLDPSKAAKGLGDVGDAADKMGKTLSGNAQTTIESFKRQAMMGLADITANVLIPALKAIFPVVQAIVSVVKDVLGWFDKHKTVTYALAAAVGVLVAAFVAFKVAAAIQALLAGLAGAFWAVNAALAANPIIKVVVVLAALAAAVVVAYKECEPFRDIVDAIAGALGAAVKAVVGFISDFDKIPEKMLDAGKAILEFIVDGIKALPGLLLDAAEWVATALFDAIKAGVGLLASIGKWLLETIVGGLKAAPELVADAATWLGGQVVALVKAAPGGLVELGKWVLNRIVDGIKTVVSGLSSVGSWLLGQVEDLVKAIPGGLVELGSWVLNRIVDGIKTITEDLSSIAGWIKNRIVEGFEAIGGGLKNIGSWIINKIVEGLKGGANLIIKFVNKIIGAINWLITKIGIPKIPKIPELATGGTVDEANGATNTISGFAKGGAFGMTGGLINRPIALMGEEAPRHPEYVIPTNPAYRGRAIGLHASLGRQLGVPGYVQGGVLDAAVGVAGKADVGKGALAGLWDTVSDGASWLIDQLPGIGDLPDWIKGGGTWVLEKVTGWIKDQVENLFGFEGIGDTKPGKLMRMMKAATDIAGKGFPYVYGGGHSPPTYDGPFDCSGYISAIMRAGGLMSGSMTTDGFKVYGEEGDGEYVTIGVRGSTGRQAHMMMQLAGRYFESGSGHGAKQVGGWSGSFPIHRHPEGLARGGIVQDAMRRMLDPAVVGWGLRQGGVLGSYENGTPYVPKTGPYVLHRGEQVVPARANGDTTSMNRLADAIERLLDSGHAGAIDALAEVVNERVGFGAATRRTRSANPGNLRYIA